MFVYNKRNHRDRRKCLTRNKKLSKLNIMIALQKPVRPATGGEHAGAPSFYLVGGKILIRSEQRP